MIEEYFKEHVPTKSTDATPKKHAAFRFLIELVGEKANIQDITRQHFQEALETLSSENIIRYEYNDLGILEIFTPADNGYGG